jgi:uncharacterized protein YkwD
MIKKKFRILLAVSIILFSFLAPKIVEAANTFNDVPDWHWAYDWIERLYNAGVTSGCGGGNYCPDNQVTRAEMAKFLLTALHGEGYTPPVVGGSTGSYDVPTNYWAAAWIKQLVVEGITSGCGGGNYCPNNNVTRAEMAKFLLTAKYRDGYKPPAVGLSTGFFDVPTNYWAASWIKQLAVEGITSGCGNDNYCPNDDVTRAEMAIFLVLTFNLSPLIEEPSQETIFAEIMMNNINQQRAFMRNDPILAMVAKERAIDMATSNYFSHINPDGHGPNYLVQQAGYLLPSYYNQTIIGNNIESICAGYPTASEAWNNMMSSDGHRSHLLGLDSFYAAHTDYGIGYAYFPNSQYGHYWVIITATNGP